MRRGRSQKIDSREGARAQGRRRGVHVRRSAREGRPHAVRGAARARPRRRAPAARRRLRALRRPARSRWWSPRIATSRATRALDVAVDIAPLPRGGRSEARARAGRAASVYADHADNVALHVPRREQPPRSSKLFAEADGVVKLELVNQRVAPVSMEGRAVLAHWDEGPQKLTRLDVDPGAAPGEAAGRAVPRPLRGAHPRGRARGRRRLRRQDPRLRRRVSPAVDLAHAAPAGEVGRDAHREPDEHHPRPRPHPRDRGRVQEGRASCSRCAAA